MADHTSIPRKLWEHPDKTSTAMWKFKTSLEKSVGQQFAVSRPETAQSFRSSRRRGSVAGT
jgi:hypothetical protein